MKIRRRRTLWLAVVATLLGLRTAPAQPDLVLLVGEPGDYIVGGTVYVTTSPAEFQVSDTYNWHTLTVTAFGYEMDFQGPGGSALQAGAYTNAVRWPFNGFNPGLSIFGHGSGCNTVCGEFEILELHHDLNGHIDRLWLTFTQHCECTMPPLTGEIRYHSALAPPLPAPRTLRVPQDYPTIQAGLDACSLLAIDTVLVAPGTYCEALDFKGRRARLVSENGAWQTLLQGPAGQTAVNFHSGETPETMLSGFTITNSELAVAASSSSPTIVSNIISGCGSGIGCAYSSPVMRNNVITGCAGSAISLFGTATPLVEGNTIEANGYGISMLGAGSPLIRNNLIRANAGDAMGMVNQCDANIIQNLIIGNGGHGIYADVPGFDRGPYIINNTLVGNGTNSGAGVYLDGFYESSLVANNIIDETPALSVTGYGGSGWPILECNDFVLAGSVLRAGIPTNLTGFAGNIYAAPDFACEPRLDFHLAAGSPCVDAGTNLDSLLPISDFDGKPRVIAGVTNGAAVVDLGAYELDPAAPPQLCLYLTCPADMVVTNPAGQNATVVSYPNPSATPGAIVSFVPPSGSAFGSGTNLVACTAVVGTNVLTCAFAVVVLEPPTIVAAPQSEGVVAGDLASFFVTARGAPLPAYQWRLNSVPLAGATNALFTIASAQEQDAGLYTVIAANAIGSVTSAPVLLRVIPAPPAIVSAPRSQTVPAGTEAEFEVTVLGSEPLMFQWWRNGAALAGATARDLVLSNVQATDAGVYQVTVSNTLGVLTSTGATLFVIPAGPQFVQQPSSAGVYSGSDLLLSAAAAGSEPLGYQWRRNGAALPGATQSNLQLTHLRTNDAGNYDVIASNALGVAYSQLAVVKIYTAPPIFVVQPQSGSVASGASLRLNAGALGSLPMVYQWFGGGNALPAQTNQALWLPVVSMTNQGAYSVVATNAFGSATSAVAQVTVIGPPLIVQGLTNQVVDAGSTVVWAVSAAGNGPLTYDWQCNGVRLDSTGPTLTLPNVAPAQSGLYQVSVYDRNLVRAVSSARLVVFPMAGTVVSWGDNSGGQTNVPVGLTNAVLVAGGDYHSLALRRDGTLIAWGSNVDGQTNVPPTATRFVSIAAGADHNVAVSEDGSVVAWGRNDFGQAGVPYGLPPVVSVAAGESHTLALLANGTLTGWGDNTYGQLSIPWYLGPCVPVRAIAAGRYHSLALTDFGEVVGWGLNFAGQTVPPPTLADAVAIAAGYAHSVALRSNGTVVVWGDNTFGQTNVPRGLSNVVAIAAGGLHTMALRADGTVVVWGDNSFAQADIPVGGNSKSAIGSGTYHCLAIDAPPKVVPITFMLEPQDLTLTEPADDWLFAVPEGDGIFRFQWYRDGVALAGATNSEYELSQLLWTNSGATYYCVVTRAEPFAIGSAQTRTATVTVRPRLPVFTFTAAVSSKAAFGFNFNTVPGGKYRVDYAEDLAAGSWKALTAVQTASGTYLQVVDPANYLTNQQRFYRVVHVP